MCTDDDAQASISITFSSGPFSSPHQRIRLPTANQDGLHTNLIEAAWSDIKRWLRARHGGSLPRLAQGDRDKLRLLIDEYSFFRLLREASADGRADHSLLLPAVGVAFAPRP